MEWRSVGVTDLQIEPQNAATYFEKEFPFIGIFLGFNGLESCPALLKTGSTKSMKNVRKLLAREAEEQRSCPKGKLRLFAPNFYFSLVEEEKRWFILNHSHEPLVSH